MTIEHPELLYVRFNNLISSAVSLGFLSMCRGDDLQKAQSGDPNVPISLRFRQLVTQDDQGKRLMGDLGPSYFGNGLSIMLCTMFEFIPADLRPANPGEMTVAVLKAALLAMEQTAVEGPVRGNDEHPAG